MLGPVQRVWRRHGGALLYTTLLLIGAIGGSGLTLFGLAIGGGTALAVPLDRATMNAPPEMGGSATACGSCSSAQVRDGSAALGGQGTTDQAVEDAQPFFDEVAAIKVGGRWGFIDKTGRMVIPPQFAETYGFAGLAPVKVDGRWGFIDKTGRMVIPAQFDNAKGFAGGLAAVQVGDRWGYIDRAGQMVIPPQFQSADSIYDRLTSAKLDDRWVYIDRTGRVVIDLQARREAGS
jgi:WG containing repeat